jgi:parallel beta-helix repeat protein
MFIFLMVLASPAWSATYYTTQAGVAIGSQPTISLAVLNQMIAAKTIVPGDMINLIGTFSGQLRTDNLRGTQAAPIVFRGDYPGYPGEFIISAGYKSAIHPKNNSFLHFVNIGLHNQQASGFTHGFQGDSGGNSFLVLDGIKSSGWLNGIYITGPGHLIQNCEVFNNRQTGIHASRVSGSRITKNYIHDNGTVGINSDGIYADHGTEGGRIDIDNNRIVNQKSTGFGAAFIDAATAVGWPGDLYIHQNTCIGWPSPVNTGIAPGGGTDDSQVYVYNNYVIGCYTSYEARYKGQHHVYSNIFAQTPASRRYFESLGFRYPIHVHEMYGAPANKLLDIHHNLFSGPVVAVYSTDIYRQGGRVYQISGNRYHCTTDGMTWAVLGGKSYTWAMWLNLIEPDASTR